MIRLDSIKIERFRGIRSGEVSGFVDVNLMIGRNNCGKSTVAEAITLATAGPGMAGNLNAYQNPSGKQIGPLSRRAFDTWVIDRREPNRSSPELWYLNDQSIPFSCQGNVVADNGGLIITTGVVVPSAGQAQPKRTSPDPKTDVNSAVRFASEVKVFVPSDASCTDIEKKTWQQLLTMRKDKPLVAAINKVFGMDVEQLSLPPDGRMMLLLPQQGLPLDVHGDGTRAALRSLIVLASMQETLFIMEEPECHQHPGSLEKFAAVVCELAKSQSVQLLITTHSIECVKAFLAAAEGCGSESAVFHLTLDDGELTSRKLDAETVESLQATGVDVRTLDLYV